MVNWAKKEHKCIRVVWESINVTNFTYKIQKLLCNKFKTYDINCIITSNTSNNNCYLQ